jgi:tail collar domain
MANVSHASLTGSNLHEPKGADTATLGTVYISDGAGSGSWASVGTSAFTGMVTDFLALEAPTGWLELDGSVVSTSTFSALYAVMAKQTSGTRTNGSAIITSIPDTSKFRIGYFVFGTGITSGSTILSVDSGTQITISNAATSSGSSVFAVSPWLLNTGTITLPDVTTAGRYRRSRTSTTAVGQVQADQNQAHTHTVSGTTNDPGNHTHANIINESAHSHAQMGSDAGGGTGSLLRPNNGTSGVNLTSPNTASALTGITITNAAAGAHTHTVTGTAASAGGTEARPTTLVLLTCVKT